jgi:hypothetical protein
LKRGVYRWKLKCIHRCKAFSYFWRNCHVLMCLRARFNISKPCTIIRSSHKKYECKQVWSLRTISYAWKYWNVHQGTLKHKK